MDVDLDSVFKTMRNGVYTMTIKRRRSGRSLAQNDLMWLWLTCIENETGTPKEDIYAIYCYKFLRGCVQHDGRLFPVTHTTSQLDTGEMTEFLQKVQADAASELGITLPDPADEHFESFFNQYNR